MEEKSLRKLEQMDILKTREDKMGTDVFKMVNLFNLSVISNMDNKNDLDINFFTGSVCSLQNIINIGSSITNPKVSYVLAPELLPRDIKKKFDNKKLFLGESRQVKGAYRATLVNENGIRVKDVPTKKVKNTRNVSNDIIQLQNQMMLLEIISKLDQMREMQAYHIDFNRNVNLKAPFLNARDIVLRAQRCDCIPDKVKLLENAKIKLEEGINAVVLDKKLLCDNISKLEYKNNNKNFVEKINLFQTNKNNDLLNQYIRFLEDDIMLLSVYTGFKINILEHLDQYDQIAEMNVFYNNEMKEIFIDKVPGLGKSVGRIMHLHYDYREDANNLWFDLEEKLNEKHKLMLEEANVGNAEKLNDLLTQENINGKQNNKM